MNKTITELTDFSPTLFQNAETPLVSIYMQTHRFSPENQQDRMRFKNLISEAESLLDKKYNRREYVSIIENLEVFMDDLDRSIWRFAKEGLAVFADSSSVYFYRLDYPVQDISFVAETYHIKPLIRNFQYGSHYYLLALSADSFELFSGDFQSVERVTLPETVKSRFEDLFDDFDGDSSSNVGSYGGPDANFYGYRSKNELQEKEIEKFFRYVDKAVKEHYIDVHPYPLALVSLPQHQSTYRAISSISCLLERGIEKPADVLSESELFTEAAAIIKEMQKSHIRKLVDGYSFSEAKETGSSDPSTIGNALAAKKISALFVEQDRIILGQLDALTGLVSFTSNDESSIRDLADEFSRMTYLQGGDVYILEQDMMPSNTGVAALFRY